MQFKRETTISTKSNKHRDIAEFLHQELSKLVSATPELNKDRYGPTGWRMHDEGYQSTAEAVTPGEVFDEFAEHDVIPRYLSTMHMAWADKKTGESYVFNCRYRLGTDVALDVKGPNRVIVDGIHATFGRIKTRLESGSIPAYSEAPSDSSSPVWSPAPTDNWLVRTFREHLVGAVITLVITLVAAAIIFNLGWN